MSHRHNVSKTVSIAALVAVVGCAKEKEVEGICIYVFDPDECPDEAGEAGGGETGEEGETGEKQPPVWAVTVPGTSWE